MKDNRDYFCACAFIDKIFIIGGEIDEVRTITNSCFQFDTSDYNLKEVANMNEARSIAACIVYDERIVVSGGYNINGEVLSSVESCDVLPNKWSSMPNMNSGKHNHSLVVVKNKLFVISKRKDDCEVFDNISKKFTTVKSPQFDSFSRITAYSIENKLYVISDNSPKIISYDTNKNKWSEESFEFSKKHRRFSSVKVPCL